MTDPDDRTHTVQGADEAPPTPACDPDATSPNGRAAASIADPAARLKDLLAERRRENRGTDGALVVHYRSRDVTLAVDGATAMRLVTTWQQRPNRVPQISEYTTSAKWRWITIDLDEVIGFSWQPDLGDCSSDIADRVTVDAPF